MPSSPRLPDPGHFPLEGGAGRCSEAWIEPLGSSLERVLRLVLIRLDPTLGPLFAERSFAEPAPPRPGAVPTTSPTSPTAHP